jgi:hypothetical protein
MAFDSAEPHLLVNEGTEPAVGIWFVLGRRQAPDALLPRTTTDGAATVLRYPRSLG